MNSRRAQHGGGFGGVSNLEKKRQYRAFESKGGRLGRSNGYGMVFDKDEIRRGRNQDARRHHHERSRSPRKRISYKERPTIPRDEDSRYEFGQGSRGDPYEQRRARQP